MPLFFTASYMCLEHSECFYDYKFSSLMHAIIIAMDRCNKCWELRRSCLPSCCQDYKGTRESNLRSICRPAARSAAQAPPPPIRPNSVKFFVTPFRRPSVRRRLVRATVRPRPPWAWAVSQSLHGWVDTSRSLSKWLSRTVFE